MPLSQEQLENHALSQGAERFARNVQKAQEKGQGATVGPGFDLMRHCINPTQEAMDKALSERKNRRGCRHIADGFIPLLGTNVAAYMTARIALSSVMRSGEGARELGGGTFGLTTTVMAIANLMLDELRYQRFKSEAPYLFDLKMHAFRQQHYQHKKKSLLKTMRNAKLLEEDGSLTEGIDLSTLDLSDTQLYQVGLWCLNHLVEATGVVEVRTIRKRVDGKPIVETRLVATEDTRRWLADRSTAMETLWPVALPMVEKPLQWAPGVRGGYRYALRGKYPLVKGTSKVQAARIAKADMPAVYEAINTLQETPWTFNRPVLQVLKMLVARGGGMAQIPETLPASLPMKPVAIEAFERERKVRRALIQQKKAVLDPTPEYAAYIAKWRAWKRQAAAVRTQNIYREHAAAGMHRYLSLVDLMAEHDQFYFVRNLDFRGREYPIAGALLSPHGTDLSKGILTFAEGKPLGPEGRRYLAQHGASCLDEFAGVKFSTLSIEDRLRWIDDHTDMICQAAEAPFEHTWWMTADAPLQFLAFCLEWRRLREWQGNTEDFISSLPCAQDGSCNGIQHFSAMLRDPIGGACVNLVPSGLPQDIYREVMNRTLDLVERDASRTGAYDRVPRTVERTLRGGKKKKLDITVAGDGALALLWLQGGFITRKLVKRPVMTYPYGSKEFGFAKQIVTYLSTRGVNPEDSKALWDATKAHFVGEDGRDVLNPACQYLARKIMSALEHTVVAAAAAMSWLKQSALRVSGNGQCVAWVVPGTGFPVRQEYMMQESKRVKTILLGKLFKPRLTESNDIPNPKKQASAIAPNVVHSLDAAAMMLCVGQAKGEGVTSFSMVHDSYAAPAGDCATLARCAREAFVRLYTEQDVVEQVRDGLYTLMPEGKALPPTPKKGDLDISQVKDSAFFFA